MNATKRPSPARQALSLTGPELRRQLPLIFAGVVALLVEVPYESLSLGHSKCSLILF